MRTHCSSRNIYSKRDTENLSEFLKVTLFLFLSKRESPYSSKSFLKLSQKDSKLSEIYFMHYS